MSTLVKSKQINKNGSKRISNSPLHSHCYRLRPNNHYLLLLLLQQASNFFTLLLFIFETVNQIIPFLPQAFSVQTQSYYTYFPFPFSHILYLDHTGIFAILSNTRHVCALGLCIGRSLCQEYSFPNTHMANFLASFKSLLKPHLLNYTSPAHLL